VTQGREQSRRDLVLYTDGAARGNPGPAGAGVHIETRDGGVVDEIAEYLGETTNNVAEYRALLLALERARDLGGREIEIRSDSELMVRQMTGRYRVRNSALLPLYERASELASAFASVAYVHVRRDRNRAADRLANAAIDAHRARRDCLSS
jgi:ribonuclease HI